MVRSLFVCAAWLMALALPAGGALIGCGNSGGGNAGDPRDASAGDAGPGVDASSSGGDAAEETGDAGEILPGDGGVACVDGGAGPKGSQLVASATVSIVGLTDDDQVVYVDTSAGTLAAVPAAGGAPTTIGATQGSVGIASDAVLNWTGVDPSGDVSTALELWTAAHGSQALAAASLVGAADSSADGTRVLYFDDATASAADLYVAGTDGSGKTKLAGGIFWTATCMPQVAFIGSSALLGYCTATPTGTGTPSGTYVLFAGATGTGTTLSSTAVLSFQNTSTNILFQDTAGALILADATTGRTTVVDAAGSSGTFSPDGQSVVYVGAGGSIERSPVASPSPTTLLAAGGFTNIDAISPDGDWLLASKLSDPNTGYFDLYVASATTAGTANTILGTATGTIYGSPFTADSSQVLYVDGAANGAGNYHAAPTSGGAGLEIATDVWIGFGTTGTKVVFDGAFVPQVGLNQQGIANIESIDVAALAQGQGPTVLVDDADPGLYFTSAGNRIVYSLTYCDVGSQGIWVMAAP